MQNAQFELNAGNAAASPSREPVFLLFQLRAEQAPPITVEDAQPEPQPAQSPRSFLLPRGFRSPEVKLTNTRRPGQLRDLGVSDYNDLQGYGSS